MPPVCVFYTLLLHLLLPSALATTTRDMELWKTGVAATVFAILVILPIVNTTNLIVMIITTVATIGVNTIMITKMGNTFGVRSMLLFVNTLICVLVYGNTKWFSGFNATTIAAVDAVLGRNSMTALLPPEAIPNALVILSGSILVSIELNNPIAFVLKRSSLMPQPTATPTSVGEPARGRVIGYLERSLVFLLLVSGNFGAIGILLAAKTFARFRQLDDRDFAEYVLIGTLLSIGSAAVLGLIIIQFLR